MLVGSLLDLGVKLSAIEAALARIDLPDKYHLHADRTHRQSIEAVKFTVHTSDSCEVEVHSPPLHSHAAESHHEHGDHHASEHAHVHGRTYAEICSLLGSSALNEWVRDRALAVFHRVAVAEAKVHGVPVDEVGFHEVGALDSIIDIVGFCTAVDWLERPQIWASLPVDGTGWIECAHGRFPIPSAATLEIFAARGVAIEQDPAEHHELLTPTGAALLAEFTENFGPMRGFCPRRVGYGAGSRQLSSRPNVIRAILGTLAIAESQAETDSVAVIESNIDDATGEVLGHTMDLLLAAGALDVWCQPVLMKKGRPGVILGVLAAPTATEPLTEILLRETTAFGVRQTEMKRRKLRREMHTVSTPFGPIEVKTGWLGEHRLQDSPEFESCRRAAEAHGVSVRQVMDAARAKAM
jgi:hypothetical protein